MHPSAEGSHKCHTHGKATNGSSKTFAGEYHHHHAKSTAPLTGNRAAHLTPQKLGSDAGSEDTLANLVAWILFLAVRNFE